MVVSGHTHLPGRMGGYHFNTGSWCRQQDTYVHINDEGSAGLYQWLESGPIPCDLTFAI